MMPWKVEVHEAHITTSKDWTLTLIESNTSYNNKVGNHIVDLHVPVNCLDTCICLWTSQITGFIF